MYILVDGICSCCWGAGTLGTFWKPKGRCFASWRPRCIRATSRAGPEPFVIAFPVFCTWPSGFETIPKGREEQKKKKTRPAAVSSLRHPMRTRVIYIIIHRTAYRPPFRAESNATIPIHYYTRIRVLSCIYKIFGGVRTTF